ncbi:hypothetical protein [Faecalicatena orotica]|uniref:hypothetical protein n=1 Tax=Faecalicatena orotica TaxID=1544 RepID=UPI003217E300
MKNVLIKRFRKFSRKYRINRTYKDQLFRLIFHNKEDLLALYNAINSTCYTNPDELIITTISDAVYLGMKNDLSFLIANVLNLYEHQSTLNPNMPLRGLFYFSDVLRAYVDSKQINIYGNKLISLPAPVYLIFYNGLDSAPDEMVLRLSDAFYDLPDGQIPALECRAKMLNVNLGHNKELMGRCQKLNEYASFIARIRGYLDRNYNLEDAVNRALDECIEEGILADILRKNRNEVMDMILSNFNDKLHFEALRKEGYDEGYESGFENGFEDGNIAHLKIQIQKKLKKGCSTAQIADLLEEDPAVIDRLIEELQSNQD